MNNVQMETCIQECMKCMQACNRCYYSCLNEENVDHMKECIRLDRECATICFYTADALSRGTPFARQVADLCGQICEACARECAKHENAHCRRCAEACRACAAACDQLAAAA
jgi:hypothetical protein